MGECLIVRGGSGTDTFNATATNSRLLEGYTCYVNDELVVGNIPKKSIQKTITPSTEQKLDYGYYDNKNLISVSTLAEETVSTAVSSDLLSTYKGYTNGTLIDGTMINNGAVNQAFGVNASYTIPQGWHNGSGKVTQALVVQEADGLSPHGNLVLNCTATFRK